MTGGVNVYLNGCVSLLVPVCAVCLCVYVCVLCMSDIKSENQQKAT